MRILDAGNNCGIDNNGIIQLTNLIELDTRYNNKITDVNHLINLQVLSAGWDCKSDNSGIKMLTNLTKLNIYYDSMVWILIPI